MNGEDKFWKDLMERTLDEVLPEISDADADRLMAEAAEVEPLPAERIEQIVAYATRDEGKGKIFQIFGLSKVAALILGSMVLVAFGVAVIGFSRWSLDPRTLSHDTLLTTVMSDVEDIEVLRTAVANLYKRTTLIVAETAKHADDQDSALVQAAKANLRRLRWTHDFPSEEIIQPTTDTSVDESLAWIDDPNTSVQEKLDALEELCRKGINGILGLHYFQANRAVLREEISVALRRVSAALRD